MNQLRAKLTGGDRRSIGAADAVADSVRHQPALFALLIDLLDDPDPVVALRAADAMEKASGPEPALLAPHAARLLAMLREERAMELKWHLAQVIPRLPLTPAQRHAAVGRLEAFLGDRSRIVQASALSALSALAASDDDLRPRVEQLINQAARNGSPALRARARKLLSLAQS